MSELRMKMIGPNTEPWRTPVASRVVDDLQPKHEIVKVFFRQIWRKPREDYVAETKSRKQALKQNGVVYGVKRCREVKMGKTNDFLLVYRPDEVIM